MNHTDLDQAHEIGKLKSEVHTLNTLVSKLFEKFDNYIEKSQSQPLTIAQIIGAVVGLLTIFALMFGTVIYIVNSSNAPILTNNAQLATLMANQQTSIQQNSNLIQLTNKEILSLKNSSESNENTLDWIIFQKEFPMKLAVLQEKVKVLESKTHLHPNMNGVIKYK